MRRPDERGDTLVEVVMALAILSLVLVSSYALATGSFRLGRGAGERTQAVNYLQQQAEALRSFRNRVGWQNFRTAVAGFDGPDRGGTFCMTRVDEVGGTVWGRGTGPACVIDNRVTIAISATSTDPDLLSAPGSMSQQYTFDIVATWNNGDTTNLQLTLTDQGATP